MLVDGAGSSLSCNQALVIEIGGSLSVQNGGVVVSDSASVNGSVTLDGAGSTWTTGMVFIAPSTYGSLTIRNGAILTSDDLAYISDGPFSGSVTVDGPGSRWDHDFDQVQLYVGFGDLGALDIANGGVVSTFSAGVGAGGGNGQLLVDGSGSA